VSQLPPKVRRTPNFTTFLLTGGILGLLVGLFLSVFGPGDLSYDGSSALGFLGLIGTGLGVLAGGLLAVLLEKRV